MTLFGADALAVALVFAALGAGGLLKGATGAGAPIVAVPVMAAVFDVRVAVVLMVAPNVVTNLWQFFHYRRHSLPGRFPALLAGSAAAGTVTGTFLLARLPAEGLALMMSVVLAGYVILRVARPGFRVPFETARRVVVPVALVGGVLQGAAGMSAPVSLSFLNAMRLERPVFIATVSAFFVAMSLVQVPAMLAFGLLTPALAGASLLALIPVLMFMPAGAWLGRRISAVTFDRVVLTVLVVLSIELAWSALT